jgi:hypothetical protein
MKLEKTQRFFFLGKDTKIPKKLKKKIKNCSSFDIL